MKKNLDILTKIFALIAIFGVTISAFLIFFAYINQNILISLIIALLWGVYAYAIYLIYKKDNTKLFFEIICIATYLTLVSIAVRYTAFVINTPVILPNCFILILLIIKWLESNKKISVH